MPTNITLTPPADLSLASLVINLLVGAVLAFVISWHFRRFGKTMSNRETLAHVFPLIVLTTVLVISVVKSSLALSLGLVGALSIVRFRTPIKEPEELAYLFVAIGAGLGLGADHRIATIVAVTLILTVLSMRTLLVRTQRGRNLYLNVDIPSDGQDHTVEDMIDLLKQYGRTINAHRIDMANGALQATFFVDFPDEQKLLQAMNKLHESLPNASITFVDQNNLS